MTPAYKLTEKDIADICSWAPTRQTLQRVSSDAAECLSPDIFVRWLHKARTALLIYDTKPQAFCTLSEQEVPNLPESYIELCHLIVDPNNDFYRNGNLIMHFGVSTARNLGYKQVCGRVEPNNAYGLSLARKNFWEEFTGNEPWQTPGFRWFRQDLSSLKEVAYGH